MCSGPPGSRVRKTLLPRVIELLREADNPEFEQKSPVNGYRDSPAVFQDGQSGTDSWRRKKEMNSTKHIALILFLGFAVVPGANQAWGTENLGSFTFYFENDLFAATDRYYTNGTKLSWISPDLSGYAESGKLPEWSLPLIRRLPFINEPGLQRNIGLSMGQNIYTPRDISRKDLVEDERPYAGWAYFGIGFYSKNAHRLDSMEIQLGMVGPASFAEQTQKFVHRLGGYQRPNGWGNQIKNEPCLDVAYERRWRILRVGAVGGFGFDAITHLGGALGNVYTCANAGIEARLGWNIPMDFGTPLIRPAGDANAPVDAQDPDVSGNHGFCLNLFASVDGRAVLRDIFLDGNTFAHSHSVDKKYFVSDIAIGISMIIHRFRLSFARVIRTKEFKGQEDDQSFGSITLSYSW